jgi:hypothetical protein
MGIPRPATRNITKLVEVSAKTGANVDEVFRIASEEFLESLRHRLVSAGLEPTVDIGGGKSGSCC